MDDVKPRFSASEKYRIMQIVALATFVVIAYLAINNVIPTIIGYILDAAWIFFIVTFWILRTKKKQENKQNIHN